MFNVTPRPLYPEKEARYPMYSRVGGPQGQSGQVRKTSPPPKYDPQTVQPVASRYTAYAIPAPKHLCSHDIKMAGGHNMEAPQIRNLFKCYFIC
jgi:hypothetical protein